MTGDWNYIRRSPSDADSLSGIGSVSRPGSKSAMDRRRVWPSWHYGVLDSDHLPEQRFEFF